MHEGRKGDIRLIMRERSDGVGLKESNFLAGERLRGNMSCRQGKRRGQETIPNAEEEKRSRRGN